jgi:hypothetical protein
MVAMGCLYWLPLGANRNVDEPCSLALRRDKDVGIEQLN